MMLVLIGEDPVATKNVAPGEWLWCLVDEPFAHFRLVCSRGIEPGVGQVIDGVMDPGWTRNSVTCAEPFHRGRTENGPTEHVRGG